MARSFGFGRDVGERGFDLTSWVMGALWDKAAAQVAPPTDGVLTSVSNSLTREYIMRARRIGWLERELQGLRAGSLEDSSWTVPGGGSPRPTLKEEIEVELRALRALQDRYRPVVEQNIEQQIGTILAEQGFTVGPWVWPPVQFTFTEPPLKLVVSRRDRIETIYGHMLAPEIELQDKEALEATLGEQPNAVAYITEIGGLGAYPTMVIDRASLRWVLSTVAHEWVHNYLTLYPLGWNYFASQEMTIINETVAEIVGNEIGDLALARYYPDLAPPPAPASTTLSEPSDEPPAFDFRTEMRATRLEVDRLLAAGDVAGAEAYMEARRQLFVENGYLLRVLNQAYFAFHGSYGTSPSSSSPISPNLDALRAAVPDVLTFLRTVRELASPEDVDAALTDFNLGEAPRVPPGRDFNLGEAPPPFWTSP
jgi:hypothetical protein